MDPTIARSLAAYSPISLDALNAKAAIWSGSTINISCPQSGCGQHWRR